MVFITGDWLLDLMIIENIGMLIFAFWYLIWLDKDKTFFLYFDTETSCAIESKKVRNGFARFKNGYFFVDSVKPLHYQRGFGFQNPFIMLKWDDIIPVELIRKKIDEKKNDNPTGESIIEYEKFINKNPTKLRDDEIEVYKELLNNPSDSTFKESHELRSKLTPSILKKIMDSEIASNLLKPLSTLDMFLYMGMGVGVGFLLVIVLQAFGIIPKV